MTIVFKSETGKRAYQVGLRVLRMCDSLPNKKAVWVISDQLLRSSMSIGANIAEAQGASSRLDFKRYYEIALKSAYETTYWLHILLDAGFVSSKKISALILEVEEITKMLSRSVVSLKSKK